MKNSVFLIALLTISLLSFALYQKSQETNGVDFEQTVESLQSLVESKNLDYFTYTYQGRNIKLPYQQVDGSWTATATHYNPAQGGQAICGSEPGNCGAPSDGSAFWQGPKCSCGSSNPTCSGGVCDDCYGKNLCTKNCPSCTRDMCFKQFVIKCIGPQGACKTTNSVTMQVTNACPQYNPCNYCKGSSNPCRGNYNHIDLCDVTFNQIAIASKQPAEGIVISVTSA